jgi:hypothetical protein
MTVVAEHALRDVTRDVHYGLVTCSAFRKIGDECVPVVVPPSRNLGVLADISPGRLEGSNGPRRIAGWLSRPLAIGLIASSWKVDRRDRKKRGDCRADGDQPFAG